MTYLGTRPILQDELQKYELHHRARIAIKPGITGMWQVSGRSDIGKNNMSVPKIIHYCWFGPKEIPEMEQKCIASWKKVLPDYKIMFWNEQNFDVNSVPYVREAYEKGKYAFVSDYVTIISVRLDNRNTDYDGSDGDCGYVCACLLWKRI